jgi:hypothetical protein
VPGRSRATSPLGGPAAQTVIRAYRTVAR